MAVSNLSAATHYVSLESTNPSPPYTNWVTAATNIQDAVGGYDTSGDARGVAVSGSIAYVADYTAGLQIIDVSNPANPVRLGGYDTSGRAYGVVVSGEVAYVADLGAVEIIDVSNPATGDCSAGQSGPVWFLAGAFVSTPITRQCTIPAGKALFFPIYNAWADNTWCPEWTTFTVDELVGFTQWYMDNAGAVACTIDGKPVKGLEPVATSPYRVGAQVFSYTLAAQNNLMANYMGPVVFRVDLSCLTDGLTVAPAVEDGVYLMLAPLAAGQHTIHFTVQGGLDITYELTVLK